MAHYLITGGAGYIGSVLVPMILAGDHFVTVIDRFYFGHETLPKHPKLTCIQQDTRQITEEQLTGIDVVIDLAAMSNDPCGQLFADLTWDVNYRARVRTASLAKKRGVQRYILPSSCSVYGFQRQPVCETSQTEPLTCYARSNLKAEQEILSLSSNNFIVTILRLATVFGYSPRMRFDLVVNAMTYSAWKHGVITVHGGDQLRPLIHIRDASSALLHISQAASKVINQQIYNIGNNNLNYPIKAIAEKIKAQLSEENLKISIDSNDHDDFRSYSVSCEKAEKDTGWTAKIDIERGICEIKNKLDKKELDFEERCLTINWYNKVLPSMVSPTTIITNDHQGKK